MKKNILLVLLALSLFVPFCAAHRGRTDENGGHAEAATGEYHYHHGFPAHDHPNGICPYEGEEPESALVDYTEPEPIPEPTNQTGGNKMNIFEYVSTIGYFLVMFIPVCVLLMYAFNFIQMPFAIIGRIPVYCVLTVKTYLLSLFFAVPTTSVMKQGLSPIPFFLFFGYMLFFFYKIDLDEAKENGDKGASNFALFSAIAAPVLYIVLTFIPNAPGASWYITYLALYVKITEIPVIGYLIDWAVSLASLGAFAIILFKIVTTAICLFIKPAAKE